MKRPILAVLAAVILNAGVFGTAAARAAAPDSTAQAMPSPAHEHGHRGHDEGHHRHHYRDHDGYGDYRDGDGHEGHEGHDGRQRRCAGLIVVCLV
ncbi:MAG TPA: hypothetical protein VGQ80_05150 [Acidimicrobiia bacterium]|nr:hypothetical protein [Acidimicrobiia bacterium]